MSASLGTGELSGAGLEALRRDLLGLRRRALCDLVAERLEASEAFSIFQRLINDRIDEVTEALTSGGPTSRPPV